MNYPISAVSLSLLKTEPKPPATNEEELEKLHSLIEQQKSKGHKYPLLACVFLLFRTAGKKTLTKNEMYNLMEKKAIEDKTKIVSSPTERYCVITQNNFKSKIKDIVKKKKWFTRALNDKGEIIYTLNDGVVCQISPKIESYLNIIEKRDGIFKNKAREEVVENIQKPKERIKKRNPKIKKIFKKYTPNNINANKLFVVTNNNLTNTNSINTLNTLNSENALNNTSSNINININTNMNMEIEDNNIINNDNKKENENANNNTILNNNESKNNDIIENKEEKNDNNESNINTSNIINNNNDNAINNEQNNNNNNDMDSMDSNIISTEKNDNDNKDNNEEENNNINNINNDITTTQIENTETIIKPNSNNTKVITNNFLIEPTFANSNNTIKKNQSKKSNVNKSINNKKKKKINKEKIEEKKLIRQSRSLSEVIEIKDNSDDFDIIIEDEREKSYINNNINNINTLSNNNLTEEMRNLNSEIEAILTGKKELNNSLTNIINNNTLTKKGTKNKKINKNYIEDISLDNTVENLDESEENNVIDLTNQRRSLNYKHQNTTPTPSNALGIGNNNKNKISNKNRNKNSNNNNNKLKHLLNNKRRPTSTLSPFNNKSSVSFYNNNNKIKKKKPLVEEKNFLSSDNDLYEEKKPAKKKEAKKTNVLGTKMSSILSMGELLLNLINKGELSQLMNKKIVYFKQKIEKKEKEIKENKKLIEDLIHSCEKIKSIKNKDILNSINDLKSYYKIFKDKIEFLYSYKSSLEKSDKTEKNNIKEAISNYKQVYIECNQILIKMVNIINTMVKEYVSLDEFVSILCLEEKENWAKQNIGLNNYDFRKKIKNARNVDDITQLFKEELDKAKIDINLFNKYDKPSKNTNNKKDVIIELNNKNNNKNKNSKEKMIRIGDKKIIKINDSDNNNNTRKNKKNNLNDTNNKENINLTNDNTSEENNKTNKNDKVESVETNYQSVESVNNINS